MANSAKDDGTLERVALDHERGGIQIERRLNAPVQEVWDALTRPDRVSSWLARVDEPAERGKRLRLHFQNSGAEVAATITEFQSPWLLEYRWDQAEIPDQGPDTAELAASGGGTCGPGNLSSTVIRYELTPLGDRSTLLTLTHRATAAAGEVAAKRQAAGYGRTDAVRAATLQSDVVIASWQNHLDGLVANLGAAPAWNWDRFEAHRSRYQALVR